MFSIFNSPPRQLKNFLDFCGYRKQALDFKKLDLSKCEWVFPSALLPLGVFLRKNTGIEYVPPKNSNVANYVSLMIGGCGDQGNKCTYLPLVELPLDRSKAETVINNLFRLHNNGIEYGGEQTFKYLISELTDNIYQHSQFNHAFVMAQRYQNHKFVEICFYDDGININGSLAKNGLVFDEDYRAIIEAINGLSAKSIERGHGLGSNIKIFTQGLKGEILVVSGAGAVYVNERKQKAYKLGDAHKLDGTMVSVKIPFPAPTVDIYAYL